MLHLKSTNGASRGARPAADANLLCKQAVIDSVRNNVCQLVVTHGTQQVYIIPETITPELSTCCFCNSTTPFTTFSPKAGDFCRLCNLMQAHILHKKDSIILIWDLFVY